MKPAFHSELVLSGDRTRVNVGGPYELEGGETDAYFWFRISQGDVEAIGMHDREKDQMAAELTAYREAFRADVAAAIAGALPAAGQPVTQRHHNTAASAALDAAVTAIAEKGPTWHKSVKARESKKFRTGAAMAEGWLLMKSVGDPRGSNQFWTSEVTLSAPAAKPARRAPAARPRMRV